MCVQNLLLSCENLSPSPPFPRLIYKGRKPELIQPEVPSLLTFYDAMISHTHFLWVRKRENILKFQQEVQNEKSPWNENHQQL